MLKSTSQTQISWSRVSRIQLCARRTPERKTERGMGDPDGRGGRTAPMRANGCRRRRRRRRYSTTTVFYGRSPFPIPLPLAAAVTAAMPPPISSFDADDVDDNLYCRLVVSILSSSSSSSGSSASQLGSFHFACSIMFGDGEPQPR